MKQIKKEHSLKVSTTAGKSKGNISKFRRPSKLADKVICQSQLKECVVKPTL